MITLIIESTVGTNKLPKIYFIDVQPIILFADILARGNSRHVYRSQHPPPSLAMELSRFGKSTHPEEFTNIVAFTFQGNLPWYSRVKPSELYFSHFQLTTNMSIQTC